MLAMWIRGCSVGTPCFFATAFARATTWPGSVISCCLGEQVIGLGMMPSAGQDGAEDNHRFTFDGNLGAMSSLAMTPSRCRSGGLRLIASPYMAEVPVFVVTAAAAAMPSNS